MYQLIFKGECVPGVDLEVARANARTLFKASLEQVDKMFSGQPVVIRNKLEQAQAEKYRSVLAKHGMLAYVQAMAEPAPVTPPAPKAVVAPLPTSAPNASGPGVEPGDRPKLAGDKVDTILAGSELSLAPVGVTLVEPENVEAPMFEHLDEWTLAPSGSDLGVETNQPPPIVPDTSHLSLVDEQPDPKNR